MKKRRAHLVAPDRKKIAAMIVLLLLFAAAGIEIDRLAFESVLRLDAETTAIAWQENILVNVPEIASSVEGKPVSPDTDAFLKWVVSQKDIFRIRIWNLQQKQIFYRERIPGLVNPPTILTHCGEKGVRAVYAGGSCTQTTHALLPGNPKHFAVSFLPLLSSGRVVGVMEFYVNLDHHWNVFRNAFLLVEIIAGITVILAGVLPLYWVYRKMQAHQRAQQAAEYLAGHDSLTGLANRKRVAEIASGALALARRVQRATAVLMLDLDHFKNINDDYGHAAGDALLQQFARRVHAAIREEDTVARLGGDEFVILQVGASQPEGAQTLSSRLLESLKQPYEIRGMSVACGSSIGVAIAPEDGADWEHLLSCADAALYRAKATGRNRTCYFQRGMEESLRERRRIEIELQRAMETASFHLVYQPIVHLEDQSLQGFEALLRWPEGWTKRLPEEFIPVAEECGLMPELGAWVLRTACAAAASWSHPVKIAVNLSPIQFRQGDILAVVSDALKSSGLAAERLELEITESLWIENTDAVLLQLSQLKRLGVSIALDDFGTGYSSLKYLWKFPFDRVKIDRSFVEGSENDPKAAAIVATITALGKALHLSIAAEGVETETQARRVTDSGCNVAQGFLFSRPVSAEDAQKMVAAMSAV